jgi:hypothetical protein
MAQLSHAQKLHRHEITLGYYGEYYFDETPFRFQDLRANKRIPTFSYAYLITRHIRLSFLYGIHDYGYLKDGYNDFLTRTDFVIGRTIRNYRISVSTPISKNKMVFSPEVGIHYRTGYKGRFLY